jgi:signal transduction histidine kinase/CHASE2 domain-containing sensor protein
VTILIVLGSAAFGTVTAWQAPGLERYARDWLTRLRGQVPVSNEIAIVAIDDASVAKLGRFPWSRTVIARAIDALSAQQPKVIALDILFTDATDASEDAALSSAIGRARNVVLAAELVESSLYGGAARWLKPLPLFAGQAAGIGHVNVGLESDGSARQLLIQQTDDEGNLLRALPVEAFRVANRVAPESIIHGRDEIIVGPRAIPVEAQSDEVTGPVQTQRAGRMAIDYAGPSGAFAAQQYGISEILDGKAPPDALRGKYVLVGSTAAALGERFASPFTHYTTAGGNQHGSSIPGVEVLANALNTILRGRFYSEMPELAALLFATLTAGLMLGLLSLAQGNRAAVRHIGALLLGLAAILLVDYLCFSQLLIFPPLIASLLSFGSAGVAGLASRSIQASAGLDRGIRRVQESLRGVGSAPSSGATTESIVRLTGVTAALLARSGRIIGAHGYPGVRPGLPREASLPAGSAQTRLSLGNDCWLILIYPAARPPSPHATRLAEALALACLDSLVESAGPPDAVLPKGLEEKTRSMVRLNEEVTRQAEFFFSSMRSVEDGLLVAGPDGRIRFANPRAGVILGSSPRVLQGCDLFEVLKLRELAGTDREPEFLTALLVNRQTSERELSLRAHRYTLRLAPVVHGSGAGDPVIGIVASLSDITRQHELARTQSDVVTLVSHEMRTPLTAIQGMTELLAEYEIEPVRRREMTLAINDEVKRLARMIGDYLDIARIEMGKTHLRLAPLRVETILERSLLLFEPLAQEKSIRLIRRFENNLPPALGDADLLARVFGNLFSNALKYSPPGTDVCVSIHAGKDRIRVEVADEGYGIPAEDTERIFEKFYRVPRLKDADVPGTGLGLTFVREIVELHGGSVELQSTSGPGSVFTVCLPYDSQSTGR